MGGPSVGWTFSRGIGIPGVVVGASAGAGQGGSEADSRVGIARGKDAPGDDDGADAIGGKTAGAGGTGGRIVGTAAADGAGGRICAGSTGGNAGGMDGSDGFTSGIDGFTSGIGGFASGSDS